MLALLVQVFNSSVTQSILPFHILNVFYGIHYLVCNASFDATLNIYLKIFFYHFSGVIEKIIIIYFNSFIYLFYLFLLNLFFIYLFYFLFIFFFFWGGGAFWVDNITVVLLKYRP